MALHNLTGKKGEALGADWVKARGFRILHRNWRCGHLEIDLIAEKGGKLHFIEIKTSRGTRFGYPEQRVSNEKLRRLLRAGTAFLALYPGWKKVEYDVLSIQLEHGRAATYYWIADVYL